MKTFKTTLTASLLALALGTGMALAQGTTTPGTTPPAKVTTPPPAGTMTPGTTMGKTMDATKNAAKDAMDSTKKTTKRVVGAVKTRSAKSLDCSKQANDQGLHGKKRRAFRSTCMKAA